MKPNLVIGLGNPLVGDEGIGWHVADRLSRDPRLPQDTEVLLGGTDLLRCGDQMEQRKRVILIDAILDPANAGTVSLLEGRMLELDTRREHAHHLSVVQALQLLQVASPSLKTVRFTLAAIAIGSARISRELSPSLAARIPHILDRVLQETTAGQPDSLH